jgi:hypothetical protein
MESLEGTPVLCKQGVAGSIPATSTNITRKFNQLLDNFRRKIADFPAGFRGGAASLI